MKTKKKMQKVVDVRRQAKCLQKSLRRFGASSRSPLSSNENAFLKKCNEILESEEELTEFEEISYSGFLNQIELKLSKWINEMEEQELAKVLEEERRETYGDGYFYHGKWRKAN